MLALAGAVPDRAVAQPSEPCIAAGSGVPAGRLRAMSRGLNLTGPFDKPRGVEPVEPDGAALADLRRRGITHLRLPLNGDTLSEVVSPAEPVAAVERRLEAALDRLDRLGFAVSLDLHLGSDLAALRRRDRAAALAALDGIWRRLAALGARRSPDRLFFEVLNEPSTAADYRDAVALAGTVRRLAPGHTIVLGPPNEQRIEALEALAPLPDRNVVYAIHFYDPMAFTHQGQDWSAPGDPLAAFKGVPFPSAPRHPAVLALGARLEREGNRAAAAALRAQLGDRWDEAEVGRTFARAAAWARRTGSAVIVNEFGVLAWHAPPADRVRWIRAVREAAERNCVGWAHWDYAEGFGMMRRGPDGREEPDPAVLDALLGPAGAPGQPRP